MAPGYRRDPAPPAGVETELAGGHFAGDCPEFGALSALVRALTADSTSVSVVDDVGAPQVTPARPQGIARTIVSSFRLIILGAVVMTLLLGGLIAWLLGVSHPQIDRFEQGIEALDNQRSGMLDQETGLRGYLVTGQKTYLVPYHSGSKAVATADRELLSIVGDRRMTNAVIAERIAEQRWVDVWAIPAASGKHLFTPGTSATERDLFLAQGKALFDNYRATEATTDQVASDHVQRLHDIEIMVLASTTGCALLLAASTVAIAVRLRSRLQRRILSPVDVLLSGLQAVREGDLNRRLPTDGPLELGQVIAGFNDMTGSLAKAAEQAEVSEQRIVDQTRQLRAVLGMVREIGGSLNSGYVMAAITDGALAISGAARAIVWVQDGGTESLGRVWDSAPGTRVTAEADAEVSDAHVLTAAKFGRTTAGRANDGTADRVAVPLIVGAQVIGVLELVLTSTEPLSDEVIDVVETLSIHAATAIEATRLHEGTTHASEHDALTGLANRRRLEADLAAECNRSLRYGNDLSFIMLDLDHFKRLNDTYGHQRGDEALQGCAAVIIETLRATDTAYRYGGEELSVIARETNLDGAVLLAERIRAAIEHRYPGSNGAIRLTASFGVAALPDHAASPEGLISCADNALYAAKKGGRNQVVQAAAPAPDTVRPARATLEPHPA
jgi:diguanylate cyclase (GGDEF)-like protein